MTRTPDMDEEESSNEERNCQTCGEPLGDRVGEYCSTACALEGRNADDEDEEKCELCDAEATTTGPVQVNNRVYEDQPLCDDCDVLEAGEVA